MTPETAALLTGAQVVESGERPPGVEIVDDRNKDERVILVGGVEVGRWGRWIEICGRVEIDWNEVRRALADGKVQP